MNGQQCKAARALLGWSRIRLAGLCNVTSYTVTNFEKTDRVTGRFNDMTREEVYTALEATLQNAGVEFTNGDAPGVRLLRRAISAEGAK